MKIYPPQKNTPGAAGAAGAAGAGGAAGAAGAGAENYFFLGAKPLEARGEAASSV